MMALFKEFLDHYFSSSERKMTKGENSLGHWDFRLFSISNQQFDYFNDKELKSDFFLMFWNFNKKCERTFSILLSTKLKMLFSKLKLLFLFDDHQLSFKK